MMKMQDTIDRFLKELSRIKSKLTPFSLEISKSSGREQHYPDDAVDDKDERRKIKKKHIMLLMIKAILTTN